MKKYIYKFFKVCIPLLLLVLITVFLIKKVNGGNVFLKKIASHETYDTEEDAFDLRKEQWNTDNNESFNTISEFSAVIFMKTYEVKSFTVIGKNIPDELQNVNQLNWEEYRRNGGVLTGDYSTVKLIYTVTDPICEREFMGNCITIINQELSRTKKEPLAMFPYVYDTLNPKHFHYQLEQNVTQEFTNYYVVPDEWLEEANKQQTCIFINPNGLSYDEDTRALGVTDAMFFKIPISSFEQEQGD